MYIAVNSWSDVDLYPVVRNPDLIKFTNVCRLDLHGYEVALVSCHECPAKPQSRAPQSTVATQTSRPKRSEPVPIAPPNPAASATQSAPKPVPAPSPKAVPPKPAAVPPTKPAPSTKTETWPPVLIESDVVAISRYGSTWSPMLRVTNRLSEYDNLHYVSCLDGPMSTIAVAIRPACGTLPASVRNHDYLAVLHFRKRQTPVEAGK
jgi:hypothetical protein